MKVKLEQSGPNEVFAPDGTSREPYRPVLDELERMGGKDVLIAPEEATEDIEEFRKMVEENPVEYVAQRPVDFSTHVLSSVEGGELTLRDSYADYRVHGFVSDPETVEIVPGAMTRVAAPGSRLVNISSGGVMKDTWVLGGSS